MKKLLLSVSFLAIAAASASAQNLTCSNNNTCGATVQFNVIAGDASTTCPPGPVVSISLVNGTSSVTEDIYAFNSGGGGTYSWNPGSPNVGSGAFWMLAQPGVLTPGYSGGTSISDASFSGCWLAPSSTTFTHQLGCVVTVTWSKDFAGNVTISAN